MRLEHDSGQVMKFVYMQKTCSFSILNMQRKIELNLLKQQVFILLSLYFICAEYNFEAFDATSEEIRLMAFYLNSDFIDVSLKALLSTSDEIRIITEALCLNSTEKELQTLLSPMDGSPAITNLSVTKKAWKNLTKSDENCVLAFDIFLICSEYRSKHNLHMILKFGSLLSTYSLSVQCLISKHDPR